MIVSSNVFDKVTIFMSSDFIFFNLIMRNMYILKNYSQFLTNFFLLVIFSLLFFVSCIGTVSNENDLKKIIKSVLTLEEDEMGEKKFVLDPESVHLNRCVQLVDHIYNDSIYYTFFNEYNKSIYFYDYLTTKFLYRIQLETEGPNGVYPYRSGYHITSFDSIYFYSLKTNYIYLLNHKGEKYRTFDYFSNYQKSLKDMGLRILKKEMIPPTVSVTTEQPLYKIGDKIYMCGAITETFGKVDSINHLIITIIDTKNNEVEFNVGYPPSYREGNWGEDFYRFAFWCYNDTNGLFLISFPNDHYIYSYQTDFSNVKKIYAGSLYAGNIKSLGRPSFIPIPNNMEQAHYFEQYYYRSIIYDKYRNIYYRIVEHPWENYNDNIDIRAWLKPISIIILDSEFNVLGERLLSMEYRLSYMNFFITEAGLYLNKDTGNEDELVYSLFKIKENE
jgi:hypothetical protein